MIEAAISDYINETDAPERAFDEFQAVAKRSMQIRAPMREETAA